MTQARTTDPPTSHLAAKKAESSGRASGQRRICLKCVVEFPGLTAAELAATANRAGIDRYVFSRRLPELRKAGFIHNGPKRICRVQDSLCTTWLPGPKPDGQLELF